MQAAVQGNKECISALIKLGANKSTKDNDEKTPLDLAKGDALSIMQNETEIDQVRTYGASQNVMQQVNLKMIEKGEKKYNCMQKRKI